MRLLSRILAAGSLLALTAGGSAIGASVAAAQPDVVGHLYVNDNTAGTNTIAAFDRHADGSLTAVPGSPFAAGGAGTGSGIGSQGALQVSSDGRYLLAVDAGSNQISVLRIKSDGGLRQVEDTPISSRGIEPVSIAVHSIDSREAEGDGEDLVYVANAGNGGSDYTGFTLTRSGQLRHLAGSTVSLPDGSQPGDVLFSGDGSHLVGTRVNTSVIDSFRVGRDGRLTAAPDSPFAAQGVGPFGSEFRPTNPTQLFVSNAHGGANKGSVSAFHDAANGTLTSIGSSPFPDLQTAPCWVEISHDGKFLFTVNTAVPSISRYAIAHDGSLTLLGSTPFSHPTALGPEDARLGPGGNTLWVVDTGAHAVSAFAVNGGNLTELPSSPTSLPAGSAPFGIVVN
jgi:6-phosphogluconolactonase (cycloisomerase 2 family)